MNASALPKVVRLVPPSHRAMQCANRHCRDRSHSHNPNPGISELPLIPPRRTLRDDEDFFTAGAPGPWRTTRYALTAACTALAQRVTHARRNLLGARSDSRPYPTDRYGPSRCVGTPIPIPIPTRSTYS